MPNHYPNLNPKKALIWRIVHRDNLPWILDNGLHCGNSNIRSTNWVDIGNPELIDKRANHPVPLASAGVLGDYVPFYFTPFSVMMKNIHSGRGVLQRANEEIVILVSSIPQLQAQGIAFLFTDSHAYYQWANFYHDAADLDQIDWSILQARDFARDPNDPAKDESKRERVNTYLQSDAQDFLPALEQASQMIDGFESPFGMELLATVDWLIEKEGCERNIKAIQQGIKNWPAGQQWANRKAQLFDERSIDIALQRLAQFQAPPYNNSLNRP